MERLVGCFTQRLEHSVAVIHRQQTQVWVLDYRHGTCCQPEPRV